MQALMINHCLQKKDYDVDRLIASISKLFKLVYAIFTYVFNINYYLYYY